MQVPAVEPLQKAGVECFAVVYSVSEVTAPQPTSYANGFVFTANDLFTQTAYLGILRAHVERMSDALKPEYKALIVSHFPVDLSSPSRFGQLVIGLLSQHPVTCIY